MLILGGYAKRYAKGMSARRISILEKYVKRYVKRYAEPLHGHEEHNKQMLAA